MRTDTVEPGDWWQSFHVIEMADLFLNRKDPQELDATCQFLVDALRLGANAKVYDQCCGVGTLSIELGKRSFNAIGADLCDIYIDRAKSDAKQQELSAEFHCADAFDFVADPVCDGVFNWFSSFGYASSDTRNETMLLRAFESLRPDGYFALDVPHFAGIMRNFQRHLVRQGESGGREVTCVRESSIDWTAGLLRQTWTWIVEGKAIDRRKSALRLYWPHQICEMLQRVGFSDINLYGGIDKSPVRLDSTRLIVVARRPQ